MKKILSIYILLCFLVTSILGLNPVFAQDFRLPAPGIMVNLSSAYEPTLIKGLTVHKDNPFLFDFIVDTGHSGLAGDALKKEGDRLVKYFFACLTIPEKDLWVNLSPYEKNRMVPQALGQTALGRDLLAEDYILKQLTASLIYPEKNLGKEFWNRVYAKAQQMYGTTQIPVNTFNKVWIVADKANVYEHGQTAFVLNGHLKVMLEEDYLAMSRHADIGKVVHKAGVNNFGSQIVRKVVLPEIEKEVNTGRNFSRLRQIFNSLILASWYKKNLKEALLNQVYADKSTVKGVNLSDSSVKEQIYQQYLKAYKKGVFNYIKEESQADGQTIPRKYFSGGFDSALVVNVIEDNLVDAAEIASAAIDAAGEFDFRVLLTNGPNSVMPSKAARVTKLDLAMKAKGPSEWRNSFARGNRPAFWATTQKLDDETSKASSDIGFYPLVGLKNPKVLSVFHKILYEVISPEMFEKLYQLGKPPRQISAFNRPMTISVFVNRMVNFLHAKALAGTDPREVAKEFRQRFSLKDEYPDAGFPEETQPLEATYARQKVFLQDMKMLKDLLLQLPQRALIADIGAGRNKLGEAILQFSDEHHIGIKSVIGSDINEWQQPPIDARLLYQPIKANGKLPYEDNSVDLAVIKWSLHHMTYSNIENSINEIKRILKPSGHVIVVEALVTDSADDRRAFERELKDQDTWPNKPDIRQFRNRRLTINKEYLSLSIQEQQQVAALEDYFGHWLDNGRLWMPMPFNYLSTATWRNIFEQHGMQEDQRALRVYGYAPFFKNGPPTVRLVFQKVTQGINSGQTNGLMIRQTMATPIAHQEGTVEGARSSKGVNRHLSVDAKFNNPRPIVDLGMGSTTLDRRNTGGIDLTTANSGITVSRDANGGVKVNFDPAMIARIRQQGIQSAVPVIIDVHMMSIEDIRPLLGFNSTQVQQNLAKI